MQALRPDFSVGGIKPKAGGELSCSLLVKDLQLLAQVNEFVTPPVNHATPAAEPGQPIQNRTIY